MKKYKGYMKQKGFTMIEVLVAMFVISVSVCLLVPIVNIMHTLSTTQYESEDYLAITQMRHIVAQSYAYELVQNELHFRYHQKDSYLTFHKRRFVKRPGYEIFLQDIDEAYIRKKGDCYEVLWKRKNKAHTAILVCE